MTTQAYSFAAQDFVTVRSEDQLRHLIAERRARGTSADCLALFERAHRSRLQHS